LKKEDSGFGYHPFLGEPAGKKLGYGTNFPILGDCIYPGIPVNC